MGANELSLAISNETALWGVGTAFLLVLFAIMFALDRRHQKNHRTPVIVERDRIAHADNLIAKHSDKYPDIRVADSTAVLKLFSGPERIKLVALLESGSIKSWARSMAKGQTPPGKDTDLLVLRPDVWSGHILQTMEDDVKQTFLKTNDRGYSTYYDVWLNSVQIKEAFPHFGTHPNTPVLEITTAGGKFVNAGTTITMAVEVTNVGIAGEISAKIGPPVNLGWSGGANMIGFRGAPAIWVGKNVSSIRMKAGDTETIIVGTVSGSERTIGVPHLDEEGNKTAWKTIGHEINKQFTFTMPLEFTTDPSSGNKPIKKKASFEVMIQGDGAVVVSSNPSMVTDA